MIKRSTLEKQMEQFVLSDVRHYQDDFYVYDKQILDSMIPGDIIFWFTREMGTNTARTKTLYDVLLEHYKGRILHTLYIKRVKGGFELVDKDTFLRSRKEV